MILMSCKKLRNNNGTNTEQKASEVIMTDGGMDGWNFASCQFDEMFYSQFSAYARSIMTNVRCQC